MRQGSTGAPAQPCSLVKGTMLFYGTYLTFFPLWKTKFCIQELHWKIGLNVPSLDLFLYLQWDMKYRLVMIILGMLVMILIALFCTISKCLFVVYHMMNELAGQLNKCLSILLLLAKTSFCHDFKQTLFTLGEWNCAELGWILLRTSWVHFMHSPVFSVWDLSPVQAP